MADDCDEYGDDDFENDAPATQQEPQAAEVDASVDKEPSPRLFCTPSQAVSPAPEVAAVQCADMTLKSLAISLEPPAQATGEDQSSYEEEKETPECNDLQASTKPPSVAQLVSSSYDEATVLKHCRRREVTTPPEHLAAATIVRTNAPLKHEDIMADPGCIASKIAAKRVSDWKTRMKKAQMKAEADEAQKRQLKREWRRSVMTDPPKDRIQRLAETKLAMQRLCHRKAQEQAIAVTMRWYNRKAALGLTTHELRDSDVADRATALLKHKHNDEKTKQRTAQTSRNHVQSALVKIAAEAKASRELACHYEHHVQGSFWLKRPLKKTKGGQNNSAPKWHIKSGDAEQTTTEAAVVLEVVDIGALNEITQQETVTSSPLNPTETNATTRVQADEDVELSHVAPLSTQENPPTLQSSGRHPTSTPPNHVESDGASHTSSDACVIRTDDESPCEIEPGPALAMASSVSQDDTDPAKPDPSSASHAVAKLDGDRPAEVVECI